MFEVYSIKLLPPTFAVWAPTKPPDRQVAVLMSGGVDSSVTAYLLQSAGWEVLGITMKIPMACTLDAQRPSGPGSGRGCCGADAAFVCHELGLPHYFVDVTEAFEQLIIRPFRAAYAQGQTPNPCVDCNSLLKFSLVWDFLREEFGIMRLATGHYARVVREGGGISDFGLRISDSARGANPPPAIRNPQGETVYLRRAMDHDKDQSYFLYGIARDRLPDFILPLGGLTKHEVRGIAAKRGLSVAAKAESMELCFVGEQDYRLALVALPPSARRAAVRPARSEGPRCGRASAEPLGQPGDVTDMQGRKIGVHKGIVNYTLGQRRGLGIAGGKPLYVGRIDLATNTVALGTREEVSVRLVQATQCNFLVPGQLTPEAKLLGKIRSYGPPRPCRLVELTSDGMTVEFEQPQFAPCPGQRLVLYDERDNVVAGGVIRTQGSMICDL